MPLVLGTISRLEKQKNIETLLLAFSKLDLDVELRIVGDGTLRDRLKNTVRSLGIQNRVQFLGKTRNISEYLDSLDIFVLASTYEGFGIVLVEAAARNKPIIASNLPVCREVLGEDGALFFDPKNPFDICEKINEAVSLLPMVDFQKNAQANISKFDLENLIARTDKIYAELG
jgi:glycosyltransferase involved in cell wall biosynthesis